MYPPPHDLQQSLQVRLSADLAQQGSGGFEPLDSGVGGAPSGGGDSGGRSGNDELTEVRGVPPGPRPQIGLAANKRGRVGHASCNAVKLSKL